MDIKDITPAICSECLKPVEAYTLMEDNWRNVMNYVGVFCSYECAEQAVNNYNADYAERKADERKYDGN